MAKKLPLLVREHLARCGKMGGRVRSEKKAISSRRNGRLAARLHNQKAE